MNLSRKPEQSRNTDRRSKQEKERRIESDMAKKCYKQKESRNNKQLRDNFSLTESKKQKMKPTRNSWFNK